MLRADGGRQLQRGVPRHHPGGQPRAAHRRQGPGAEALRRRHPRARHRVRHRPGRHRQDLPGHGAGHPRADGEAGQAHRADPPRGRGRRAARLPAGQHGGEGLALPAARSTTRSTT